MQQQRWVAGAAEEHATMASASALSKPRAYYYNVGVSIGKDSKRGCFEYEGRTLAAMARK